MPYDMTTKFYDTTNGEEYEFLGTSISFSERELINLEEEHDKSREMFVEQLISDGYFSEDWTDYYDNTDSECESEDDAEYEKDEESQSSTFDEESNKENHCIESQSMFYHSPSASVVLCNTNCVNNPCYSPLIVRSKATLAHHPSRSQMPSQLQKSNYQCIKSSKLQNGPFMHPIIPMSVYKVNGIYMQRVKLIN
eukprot:74725_1